jgi:hypothetical protein
MTNTPIYPQDTERSNQPTGIISSDGKITDTPLVKAEYTKEEVVTICFLFLQYTENCKRKASDIDAVLWFKQRGLM